MATLEAMRRRVTLLREQADKMAAAIPKLREAADKLEAALNATEEAEKSSLRLAHGGTVVNTMSGTNATTNPIAHAHRIEAITRKAREGDARPFIRWIGGETLQSWAARHHDADGQPLKIDRLRSYLRRDPGRHAAPEWFREMVYLESGGKVSRASWDSVDSPTVKRKVK